MPGYKLNQTNNIQSLNHSITQSINPTIMTVANIVKALDLRVYSGEEGLNRIANGGYVSDLLSDVMGNADAESIWITLQSHKNVMAIASLKELAAVILVKGIEPDEDTAAQSNQEQIPILGTDLETFEIAGRLYSILNLKH
jgi:predicted transcriptional regulator